jgi:hypothetical protein
MENGIQIGPVFPYWLFLGPQSSKPHKPLQPPQILAYEDGDTETQRESNWCLFFELEKGQSTEKGKRVLIF